MNRLFFLSIVLPLSLLSAGCASLSNSGHTMPPTEETTSASEPPESPYWSRAPLTRQTLYRLLMGEIAIQRGQAPAVIPHYLALAEDTQDPRLAQRVGDLAEQYGYMRLALQATELWAKLDPTSQSAQLQRVLRQVAAYQLEAADQSVPPVLLALDKTKRPAFLLELVRRSHQHPDTERFFEWFKPHAAAYRGHPTTHYALSLAARQANQPTLALEEIETALRLKPNDPQFIWIKVQLLDLDRPEKATAWLGHLLKEDPNNQAIVLNAVRLLARQGREAETLKRFEMLIEAQPNNGDLQLGLGILALDQKMLPLAKTALNSAQRLGVKNQDSLFYQLGQLAEAEKSPEAAVEWYAKIEQGEYLTPAVLARTRILSTAKRYPDLLKMLEKAIALHPKEGELRYQRALVAETLGDIPLAESDLKNLTQIEGRTARALNALGYTLANHTTRLKEAQKLIQEALTLEPENAAIIDSLGWVQYKRRQFPSALKTLKRAYALQPEAEIAAHLGEVLWKMGQKKEAENIWKTGLKKDSSDATLKATLERLAPQLLKP